MVESLDLRVRYCVVLTITVHEWALQAVRCLGVLGVAGAELQLCRACRLSARVRCAAWRSISAFEEYLCRAPRRRAGRATSGACDAPPFGRRRRGLLSALEAR